MHCFHITQNPRDAALAAAVSARLLHNPYVTMLYVDTYVSAAKQLTAVTSVKLTYDPCMSVTDIHKDQA